MNLTVSEIKEWFENDVTKMFISDIGELRQAMLEKVISCKEGVDNLHRLQGAAVGIDEVSHMLRVLREYDGEEETDE